MVQNTIIPTIEETEATPQCRHHWVIQPADGLVSQGVCQVCGEIRDFKNYVEAGPWGDSKRNDRDSDAGTPKIAITVPIDLDDEDE